MLHFWGLELNCDSPMIGNVQPGIPILAKGHIENESRNEYNGVKIL